MHIPLFLKGVWQQPTQGPHPAIVMARALARDGRGVADLLGELVLSFRWL